MDEVKKSITIKIDSTKYPELKGINLKDLFFPLNQIGNVFRDAFKNLELQLAETFNVIRENFAKIPEITKNALILLANKGWYLPSMDFSLDLHYELAVELLKGNEKNVDSKLCELIKIEFNELSQRIMNIYPHRRRILGAACKAHLNKEYALSIPVFLSQADGICKETIGHDLFKKNKDIPDTAKYVAKFIHDPFMASLLEPFRVALPISYSEKQRKNNSISLNRHQILHGEVYDYDTELNSYKSFSFLSYVCSILEMAKNNKMFVKPL